VLPQDEDYETLGGLVSFHLERIPEEGDRVDLEVTDLDRRPHRVAITVTAMDHLRVDRVRLEHEPLVRDHDEDAEDTA